MDTGGISKKLVSGGIKTAVKLMPIVPLAAITIGTVTAAYTIVKVITKK